MRRKTLLLGLLPLLALGCGSASVPKPVVLRTQTVEPGAAYQAALATVQAQGYPIVAEDQSSSYLRVRAHAAPNEYIAIRALPGVIDIYVEQPNGLPQETPASADLRRQMKRIARGIARRTPVLEGPAGTTELPILEPPLP